MCEQNTKRKKRAGMLLGGVASVICMSIAAEHADAFFHGGGFGSGSSVIYEVVAKPT